MAGLTHTHPAPLVSNPTPTPNMEASIKKQYGRTTRACCCSQVNIFEAVMGRKESLKGSAELTVFRPAPSVQMLGSGFTSRTGTRRPVR